MKTLLILLAACFVLNTNSVMSSPKDLAKTKKSVRNQINYSLATSDIEEKGTVTIYFYVYDKKVKVQKVEGTNEKLNQQVKQRIEKTGFSVKGLNGYYTVTIRLNGDDKVAFIEKERAELRKLTAAYYMDLKNLPIPE